VIKKKKKTGKIGFMLG